MIASHLSHCRQVRTANMGYHSDRATALSTELSPPALYCLFVVHETIPQASTLQTPESHAHRRNVPFTGEHPTPHKQLFPGIIVPSPAWHPAMLLWWHLESGTEYDLKNEITSCSRDSYYSSLPCSLLEQRAPALFSGFPPSPQRRETELVGREVAAGDQRDYFSIMSCIS